MSHCQQRVEVEYREIPGVGKRKQRYRVGDDGSVWSLSFRTGAEWKRLKPVPDRCGYHKVKIAGQRLALHRLVLTAFAGEPADPGMVVRHLDDDKSNNRRDNLCWGFPADNVGDAFVNARMWVGSRVHCAKIDEADARAIVAAHRSGETQAELGRRYGLSIQGICNIISGHSWSHVTGIPYNPRSRARRLTPVPTVHPATPTT